MKFFALFSLFLSMASFAVGETSPVNWSGQYAPCKHHADLLNPHHVDLGVRISTANALLAQQFERAMEFWSEVLDIDWHEVDSEDCAIQLVDGTPSLFNFCICLSARSQFPDRRAFEGWIAFNPRLKLTKHQMFVDSVHEIGHLLGLPHNPNDSSVMYYFGLDKAALLDATDLESLAMHHELRAGLLSDGGTVREVRVLAPRQNSGHGQGWLQSITSRMKPFQY